jgi:hypothetical protein
MKTWETTRKALKKKFLEMGITRCELCGSSNFLSFAHSKNRRHILTQKELEEVALLCIPCHEAVEGFTAESMRAVVRRTIRERKKRCSE